MQNNIIEAIEKEDLSLAFARINSVIFSELNEMQYILNHKILDFRHSLNDQLLLLKYGTSEKKGICYTDPILINHEH